MERQKGQNGDRGVFRDKLREWGVLRNLEVFPPFSPSPLNTPMGGEKPFLGRPVHDSMSQAVVRQVGIEVDKR